MGYEDNGSGSDSACVFPFTYDGETYAMCTRVDSHRPWCSYASAFPEDYEDEDWGWCDTDLCPLYGRGE